mmetsp:Transcript_59887/g.175720  ORF Transcript_59887/g.175720 Transcript_59887/m.175720 type:complete len:239 (-) Transcript_59887:16-732(-)
MHLRRLPHHVRGGRRHPRGRDLGRHLVQWPDDADRHRPQQRPQAGREPADAGAHARAERRAPGHHRLLGREVAAVVRQLGVRQDQPGVRAEDRAGGRRLPGRRLWQGRPARERPGGAAGRHHRPGPDDPRPLRPARLRGDRGPRLPQQGADAGHQRRGRRARRHRQPRPGRRLPGGAGRLRGHGRGWGRQPEGRRQRQRRWRRQQQRPGQGGGDVNGSGSSGAGAPLRAAGSQGEPLV